MTQRTLDKGWWWSGLLFVLAWFLVDNGYRVLGILAFFAGVALFLFTVYKIIRRK